MRSASTARQPVSASSASSAPMSQEAPTTPPAPRTRPTRMAPHRTQPRRTVTRCALAASRVRKGPRAGRTGASAALAARGLRNRPPNVGCMTAQGGAGAAETPADAARLRGLGADDLIRPAQVAAVLSGARGGLPRHAPARRAPARPSAARVGSGLRHPGHAVGLAGLPLESPLHVAAGAAVARLHRSVLRLRLRRRARLRRAHALGARLRSRARGLLEQPPRRQQPQGRVDGVAGVARVQARGGGAHGAVPAWRRSTSR